MCRADQVSGAPPGQAGAQALGGLPHRLGVLGLWPPLRCDPRVGSTGPGSLHARRLTTVPLERTPSPVREAAERAPNDGTIGCFPHVGSDSADMPGFLRGLQTRYRVPSVLPPRLPLSPRLVQPGHPRPGRPPCPWLPAGRSRSDPRNRDPRPGGASDPSPCAVPMSLSHCVTPMF